VYKNTDIPTSPTVSRLSRAEPWDETGERPPAALASAISGPGFSPAEKGSAGLEKMPALEGDHSVVVFIDPRSSGDTILVSLARSRIRPARLNGHGVRKIRWRVLVVSIGFRVFPGKSMQCSETGRERLNRRGRGEEMEKFQRCQTKNRMELIGITRITSDGFDLLAVERTRL
jgi:hypothetical protein